MNSRLLVWPMLVQPAILARSMMSATLLIACNRSEQTPREKSAQRSEEPAASTVPQAKPAPRELPPPVISALPLAERVNSLRYVGSPEVPPGKVLAISETYENLCAALEGGEVWCRRGTWEALGWNAGADVVSLSASRERVCALAKDGAASCNEGPSLGAGPWRDISVAREGACGVRRDGDLVCKASTELGDVPEGAFTEVECHHQLCCALLEAGGAACWGKDSVSSGWPKGVLHDLNIGDNGSCALDHDGNAACWGVYDPRGFSGNFESLEVGTASACGVDKRGRSHCWMLAVDDGDAVPPVVVADVALGYAAGCLLDHEGGLLCWGDEAFGPVPSGRFTSLSGGKGAICGLREDGHPACWGFDGDKTVGLPDEPLQAISAGTFTVCGLRENGELYCWGSDFKGARYPPSGFYVSLAVGITSCALDEQGRARCWLGAGLQGEFISLAAGSAYTCGLRADGTIECTVGDPFFEDRSDPTPPAGLKFRALYSGYEHLCGLDERGRAHCWGRGVDGETSAPEDATFSMLALGEKRSCGLTGAGEVRCWGGRPNPPPGDGPYFDIAMTENTDLINPAYVCALRKSDAGVSCWAY